jgi:hypothetical protein
VALLAVKYLEPVGQMAVQVRVRELKVAGKEQGWPGARQKPSLMFELRYAIWG